MQNNRVKRLSKYSGVAAILILWLAIPLAMHLIGLHFFGVRPISYLGVVSKTRLLFSSSLIVAAVLMILFGIKVKNAFHASKSFLVILTFGQLCQVITAIIIDSGQMKQLHTIAAFSIAFSLPLLMWRFAASQSKERIRQLSYSLLVMELASLAVGISLFVFVSGVGPFGEVLTVVFFHLWVFVTTAHWPVE